MTPEQLSAVLCYVDYPWAYFTTQPLAEAWGDDWNDAPYEHNAGSPYPWRETVRSNSDGEWKMIPNPSPRYSIIKVAYSDGDLETPSDLAGLNSTYSVEDINGGAVAWLTDPGYGTRPRVFTPVVWAGISLAEFIKIIEGRDGRVYLPHDPEPTFDLTDSLAEVGRIAFDAMSRWARKS